MALSRALRLGIAVAQDTLKRSSSSKTLVGRPEMTTFSPSRIRLRVVKIAEGERVNSESQTQWIGDHEAYQRFRHYESRHHPRIGDGRAINAALFADEMTGSPASDLFSVLRKVVADPSVVSADGFQV